MPYHPFLFAIDIVLSLYASNAAQVPVGQIFRPLVFFLLLAGFLYWAILWRSKDNGYAAYAASWILLWLALFGHLSQTIELIRLMTGWAGNEYIVLVVWTLVMGFIGAPMVWRNIRNKKLVNNVLTAVAIGMVILPAFTTANALYSNQPDSQLVETWKTEQPSVNVMANSDAPDIYYIILDGYARADILQDTYGFNNSDFISALTERSFRVADASHSNYMHTALSLASSMNMEYVNFLADVVDDNRAPAYEMIASSRVRAALEEAGYQSINIASPVLFTQLLDFDQYLAPGDKSFTEFEKLIISTTSVAPLVKDSNILIPSYQSHRIYTLYAFDTLGKVASTEGPKFVFTHVVAPHPPFVFDAQGNPVQSDQPYAIRDGSGFPGTREEYITGYINEMQYINTLTLQAVDAILQNSSRSPIIIIQGDHGPGAFTNLFAIENSCSRERGSILNAYYFPNGNYDSIPANITPVNTFRVILNQYFGTDLPILDNHVFFSYWDEPYNFVDVTDQMDEPCEP